MATEVVPVNEAEVNAKLMHTVMVQGNLATLTAEQKVNHYVKLCESLKLNPMTKPFLYVILNDKLTLYATKDCTEQLRKLWNVSVKFISRQEVDGTFEVVAEARDYSGRVDQASGVVPITDDQGKKIKSKDMANARMKAETKAKRRVTLSICGLGVLDETELDTVRDARKLSWEQAVADKTGQPATHMDVEALVEAADAKGIDNDTLMSWANVKQFSDLTREQINMLMVMVDMRVKQEGENNACTTDG